jgi:predicted dehydrogenase
MPRRARQQELTLGSFEVPSRMYRGAIVGLGNVALNGHVPGWKNKSEFQIVAGVDPHSERRSLFLKAVPEAFCTDTLAQLPEDLDFVDICTPPHTHFKMVMEALERGWNVLCEKPLVLASCQLDQIHHLAKQRARLVFTVHNWKFAPICRKISELISSGALGQIHHCDWQVLRTGPSITADARNWRLDPDKAGGGILVDHGWHAFYLVIDWMGADPSSVQASLENRRHLDLAVEDTAIVTLRFDSLERHGSTANIFLTWASPQRRNSGTIQGTLARLTIEDDWLKLARNDGGEERFHFTTELSSGSHHPDWFRFVAEEFAGELKGSPRPGRNLRVAQLCLRLVEQSKASSRVQEYLPV